MKDIHDSTYIIKWNVVQVEPEREFQMEPLHILDKKETILWNRVIAQVKVKWKHFILEEETWELEGEFQVEPVRILDRKETVLRNRFVARVKVQWKHFIPEEVTWELEEDMQKKYPGLFPEDVKED